MYLSYVIPQQLFVFVISYIYFFSLEITVSINDTTKQLKRTLIILN